jgi:hypothetical protein
MKIGYVWERWNEEAFNNAKTALTLAGCDLLYADFCPKQTTKKQFFDMIKFIEKHDKVVLHDFNSMPYNLTIFFKFIRRIVKRGATLSFLNVKPEEEEVINLLPKFCDLLVSHVEHHRKIGQKKIPCGRPKGPTEKTLNNISEVMRLLDEGFTAQKISKILVMSPVRVREIKKVWQEINASQNTD